MMAKTEALSPEQAQTLLDILTHNETYKEIEEFKSSKTIKHYGPPFQDDQKPTTPILQGLVTKFAITLPGLRDVQPAFWQERVQGIVEDLADAELSESYDKGNLGIRKTLATAISSLIEYPARALLGAFPKDEEAFRDRKYDVKNPDDVLAAWPHFLQNMVYSDLFDSLYKRASETYELTEHDTLTQAAHEFIIVNLASFMHYTLILSPEGQTLVRMLDSVNKLAPYALIRQTLRVGNVATMISGMMRLMLAKMSAGSFTNWMGITAGADEGMNLLQQIISTVLGWDKRELKKRLEKIDKDPKGPNQEVKEELREYLEKSREEHQQIREQSIQSKMSIVQTILSLSPADPEMSESQHSQALEYLSVSLAIRDRNEIIRVLCKSSPDNLSQAVRDAVAAYEPMIRKIHNAVDLSATVGDLQAFMDDMLKLSRPDKSGDSSEAATPSVEDFVHLLHSHQMSSHKFIHQVAKNGDDVTIWFRDYCQDISAHFKDMESDSSKVSPIFGDLDKAFADLPEDKQKAVKAEIDKFTAYLKDLHDSSANRVRTVIKNENTIDRSKQSKASAKSTPKSTPKATPANSRKSSPSRKSASKPKSSMVGPGAYLARWQNLLDTTLITPSKAFGDVRTGADTSVREESNKDVDGETVEGGVSEKEKEKLARKNPAAPSVEETIDALGPKFKEILKARS